jgi:hypothetical protein
MRDEFSCHAEVYLKDANETPGALGSASGRIDIIIQTDNGIIGVENKLDANFQSGQPDKYLSGLRELAKSQDAIGKQKKYILVILAPRDRNAEIKAKISKCADSSHYVQLDWEELLAQLTNACSRNSDRISQTVIEQLNDYVINNRRLWPNELFAIHLQGTYDPSGIHGDFIRKLTRIFPAKGRLGTGQKTIGYHLDMSDVPASTATDLAWLGFIRRDQIEDGKYDTELIFATTLPKTQKPPSQFLRLVHVKNEWGWPKPMTVWAVDYSDDDLWKRPDTWRSLFTFLFES